MLTPTTPKPPIQLPPLFLGIDLAQDSLKAVVVDDVLDVVFVECVNYDQDLPEYQSRNGVLSPAPDAQVAPVEMWIKALDILFDRLHSRTDLSRVSAIGTSAISAPLFLVTPPETLFGSLNPSESLHIQVSQNVLPSHVPVPTDLSSHAHSMALEAALGGPDKMAYRVGVTGDASLLAAQVMRLRELDNEAWSQTHRIGTPTVLLGAILSGEWDGGMSESEAFLTGFWNPAKGVVGAGVWDKGVCEVVGGGDGAKVKELLGNVVQTSTGGKSRRKTISKYWVERYGLKRETILSPSLPPILSTYLSVSPKNSDAVLLFGHTDYMLFPTSLPVYKPSRLATLVPHPLSHEHRNCSPTSEKEREWIGILPNRNADMARTLVRDMYTKSWAAFDRLVAIVPPGGSIGLDNKLFAFWILTSEGYPHSLNKGIHRFETGCKVHEFRDLRANPRVLVESQLMSYRVRFERLVALGIFAPPSQPPPDEKENANFERIKEELGLGFNPYENWHLPRRIICAAGGVGEMSGCTSVVNCLTDLFDASVWVPGTVLEEMGGSATPPSGLGLVSASPLARTHSEGSGISISSMGVSSAEKSPGQPPSRCALGGAYLARWLFSTSSGSTQKDFEESTRSVLLEAAQAKAAAASARGRSPRPGSGSTTPSGLSVNVGLASGGPLSAGGSMGRGGTGRSGLAAFLINDEDEDDDSEGGHAIGEYKMNGNGISMKGDEDIVLYGSSSATTNGRPIGMGLGIDSTRTTPNLDSFISPLTTSTAFTTPDPSSALSPSSSQAGNSFNQNFAVVTPLEDPNLDGGGYLSKVAESDNDAFMQYGALIPEFCRLEAMVVRGGN